MTFRIYDAYTGGNKLWDEANKTVITDSNGVFNTILSNINLTFAQQYFLGVLVMGDSEMTPRMNLTSSPYTFRANISDYLDATRNYEMQNLTVNAITNLSSWPDSGGYYNVKAYGALGDGTTNNVIAIQNAITAANSSGGGIVFFPKGTYRIASALSMKSNVFLEGVGESSVIYASENKIALYYAGTAENKITNTGIRNLKFLGTGNAADTGNTLITMDSFVENAWIDTVWFVDAGYDAFHMLHDCKNIYVTNCYVINAQDDGFNPGGSATGTGTSDIILHGNYIENVGNDGIHLSDNSKRVSAIGNIIVNSGTGIGIYNSGYHLIENNVIRNCSVGIKTISGTTPYLKISGNLIDTTTSGAGISLSHNHDYSIIRGNTILSSNSSNSHGITENGGDYVIIDNNIIQNAKYGINAINSNHISITGNMITAANRGINMLANNSIISNNNIENITDYGTIASGGTSYMNLLISGNNIKNVNNNDGVYTNTSQSLVTNNIIRNTGDNSIEDTGGNNRIITNDIDGAIASPATTGLLHVNLSGHVGIGTTTPTEKLEVYPDTDNSAVFGRAHIGYVGLSDYAAFSHIDNNITTEYALMQSASGTTYVNTASIDNPIYFRQGNADLMALYYGKLGIGITTPGQKLVVDGDLNVTGTSYLGNFVINAENISVTDILPKDSDKGVIIRNGSGGKLGLFNTTKGRLEVWNPAGGANDYVNIYHDGGSQGFINTGSGSTLLLGVGGTTVLILGATALNPNGANVIDLGWTSGEYKALFLGEDKASGAYFGLDQDWRLYYNETPSDSLVLKGNGIFKVTDTAESANLFINTSLGKIGINMTSPAESLHVSGNINVTGNVYVGGCLKYNCSQAGGCVTLGICV